MTSTSRRVLAMLLVTVTLVACNYDVIMKRMTPTEHDQFARKYIAALRTRDFERGVSVLHPGLLKRDAIRDSLAATVRRLPDGPADTLRLVGLNVHKTKGVKRSRLVYEFQTPSGWGVVTILVIEELGMKFVEGVFTARSERSLREQNAFTLYGKSLGHFAVLMLALMSALASLSYAVAAALTPMPRRWLWAVVALFGGSRLMLNWTTGDVQFQLFAMQFLGGGMSRVGPVGPWIMSVSVPIGAIVAFERIQRWRARTAGPRQDAVQNESRQTLDTP